MLPRRRGVFLMLLAVFAGGVGASTRVRAQESSEAAVVKNPAPTDFVKIPGAPDCITAAVQRGDPSKGPSTMLLKATAGCAVPWHLHTPNEQLMMVTGVGQVHMKGEKAVALRPGGYGFAPSHHVHRFSCSGPCVAYLHSDGAFDIHYVDETGKEISLDQALKVKTPARAASK